MFCITWKRQVHKSPLRPFIHHFTIIVEKERVEGREGGRNKIVSGKGKRKKMKKEERKEWREKEMEEERRQAEK